MQIVAFVVFSLLLVEKICLARLIIDESKVDESLVETSIDILESCYADRIGTVGIAGSSTENLVKSISLRETVIPLISLDDSSKTITNDSTDRIFRHKLRIFLIAINDPSSLVTTLVQVKNSKWWNHMASFLLIDLPPSKNECSNAHEILWEAWKMNLLNAKFICIDQTKETSIYTFNPYVSKAPVPWIQENTYKGLNDHVWTLFVQKYRNDETRCDALDYDKTTDLGGYEIRASVEGMENWGSDNSTVKPTIRRRVLNITAQILLDSVNATWKLLKHKEVNHAPRDANGNPTGIAADVIDGISDISLNILDKHVWTKQETTYPLFYSGIAIMTQYPGHKTQLEKIASVLDHYSRLLVLLVIFITLAFFKFCHRKSMIVAAMNVILVICDAAVAKLPKKLSARIYLASLFMLMVTIQGIYQGKMASILTKPVRLPNVDSINDIARTDHTIYGLDTTHFSFNQTEFRGRYVELQENNCTRYVLKDVKAACAHEKLRIMSEATKFKLHLSKETVVSTYGIYLIRTDWPLEERINRIYERAAASGIITARYNRELEMEIAALASYENEDKDRPFESLNLKQLGFAFAILLIGLLSATVAWVIEVCVYDIPIASHRNRIRRRIGLIV